MYKNNTGGNQTWNMRKFAHRCNKDNLAGAGFKYTG